MSESAPAIYCLSGLGVDERDCNLHKFLNRIVLHQPFENETDCN